MRASPRVRSFAHWYYLFIALAAAQLAWQTAKIDFDDPADCLDKFKSNRLFGWLMLGGIALAAV